jgi:hypothetical protein
MSNNATYITGNLTGIPGKNISGSLVAAQNISVEIHNPDGIFHCIKG